MIVNRYGTETARDQLIAAAQRTCLALGGQSDSTRLQEAHHSLSPVDCTNMQHATWPWPTAVRATITAAKQEESKWSILLYTQIQAHDFRV